MSRLKDIVIDCADAWTLASWWAPVLGYQMRVYTEEDYAKLREQGIERPEDDPDVALDPIDEKGPSFWFCQVPEPKTVKNRVHIDVFGDLEEVLAHGATHRETFPKWTVLADPEGNEFCLFPLDQMPA